MGWICDGFDWIVESREFLGLELMLINGFIAAECAEGDTKINNDTQEGDKHGKLALVVNISCFISGVRIYPDGLFGFGRAVYFFSDY